MNDRGLDTSIRLRKLDAKPLCKTSCQRLLRADTAAGASTLVFLRWKRASIQIEYTRESFRQGLSRIAISGLPHAGKSLTSQSSNRNMSPLVLLDARGFYGGSMGANLPVDEQEGTGSGVLSRHSEAGTQPHDSVYPDPRESRAQYNSARNTKKPTCILICC